MRSLFNTFVLFISFPIFAALNDHSNNTHRVSFNLSSLETITENAAPTDEMIMVAIHGGGDDNLRISQRIQELEAQIENKDFKITKLKILSVGVFGLEALIAFIISFIIYNSKSTSSACNN